MELLPVTQIQRKLVVAKASAEEIGRSAVEQGMLTMKQDGIQKVLAGLTTVDEVMRVTLTERR